MLLRTAKVDSHFTVPSSDTVTFESCPLEQLLTIFVSIVSWIETIPFTNCNDAASASCVSYPGTFLRVSKVKQHQHEMGTWTGAQWSFKIWPKQGNRLLSAIAQIINYVVLNVLCWARAIHLFLLSKNMCIYALPFAVYTAHWHIEKLCFWSLSHCIILIQ